MKPIAPRHLTALILLLGLCGFFWDLSGRDLWRPDETRYAQVAREMVRTHQWLLPHLNGEVYSEKPPFFFWCIAAVTPLTGGDVTEVSARLPSALAALGVVLLLAILIHRLFDTDTALMAAAIFATSTVALGVTHAVFLDMVFMFFVLAGILSILLAHVGPRTPIASAARRKAWQYALTVVGFAALGIATLTKGPLAFLIAALVFLTYLAFTGRMRQVLQPAYGLGLVVYIAVCLAWIVPLSLDVGLEHIQSMFQRQVYGRAFEPFDHVQPAYYYLGLYPAMFLPWSVFLPTAIFHAWENRARFGRLQVTFLTVWMASLFIFFSLLRTKGPLYLLPAVPAGVGLVALLWKDYLLGDGVRGSGWRIRIPMGLLGTIIAAAGPAGYFIFRARYPDEVAACLPAFLGIGISGLLLWVAAFFRRPRWHFGMLGVYQMALLLLLLHALLPVLNPLRSNRVFLEKVSEIARGRILLYELPPHTTFYTGRTTIPRLHSPAELEKEMQSDQIVHVILDAEDFERFRAERQDIPLRQVHRGMAAGKDYVLAVNRDAR